MHRFYILLIGLLAAVLAACGSGTGESISPQPLAMEAQEFQFAPSRVEVRAGQPVKLTIQNSGTVEHDFSIARIALSEKAKSSQAPAGHDMAGMEEPDVHVAVPAGRTGTVEFTPTRPGVYQFTCTVPGHLEAGMKGDLVVQ